LQFGGRLPGLKLGVGPTFAGFPERIDLLAELLAGLDLDASQLRLGLREVSRSRRAACATCKTEVWAMPGLEILLAAATDLAALHVPLRQRACGAEMKIVSIITDAGRGSDPPSSRNSCLQSRRFL